MVSLGREMNLPCTAKCHHPLSNRLWLLAANVLEGTPDALRFPPPHGPRSISSLQGSGPGSRPLPLTVSPGVLPSATWAFAWVLTPPAPSGDSHPACAQDATEGILGAETQYLSLQVSGFRTLCGNPNLAAALHRGPSNPSAWIKLKEGGRDSNHASRSPA